MVRGSWLFMARHFVICRTGLDLVNGVLRDTLKAGVLEPAMSKIKQFKAATEAAISILRIDDMIKIDPPQQEQDPHGH